MHQLYLPDVHTCTPIFRMEVANILTALLGFCLLFWSTYTHLYVTARYATELHEDDTSTSIIEEKYLSFHSFFIIINSSHQK